MSYTTAREEQVRSNRRLARQILGAVALVLALIGLFTMFGWVLSGIRIMLDDTDKKLEYQNRVYGLVIFDTPGFEDVSEVGTNTFLQAAIWSCIYQAQMNEGNLDSFERDAMTGSVLLPRLEVDTYISNLLGPDYQFEDGSFTTSEFNYTYDPEKQCYLVPVTGSVAMYNPMVAKLSRKGGTTTVTVGYIPTLNNTSGGDLNLTAPTDPTKYMDYIFTKQDGKWYLTALKDSEMQPASTPVPTAVFAIDDPQAMLESQLDSTMTDAVVSEEPSAEEPAEGSEENPEEATEESTEENPEESAEPATE